MQLITKVRKFRDGTRTFLKMSGNSPARKNLLGDRDIEWAWTCAHIPMGPGRALDFGTGGSFLGLVAAERGFQVTSIDLLDVSWPYVHPRLSFTRGDIAELPLVEVSYDLVINCSTVEHVGLAGRYGVSLDGRDGDLSAMRALRGLMASNGIMLMTIPAGRDAVFPPMCRVYGEDRLPRLLNGFNLQSEQYWVKDDDNRWVRTTRAEALDFEAHAGSNHALQNAYALGCFVLQPATDTTD
jgi:hypothetical protein